MKILFWDCDHAEYEEIWDKTAGEEYRFYMCHHPKGVGYCPLENKYANNEADCKLLDE